MMNIHTFSRRGIKVLEHFGLARTGICLFDDANRVAGIDDATSRGI
jgi:hypothetical protein